ncbi:Lrp/AsnC family transcriptional regulator [Brevibacillus marinus]|mgnify:CR=1 FL=1|uniref:Lrp/AsnC family transcriptional regulator n=1 Tax=Brevibacillus marinus TaxID=2496837 RepID=UPI000F826810|nr:Lrp/AsnC family transcriptional regulator [Brevibacillus marinus]
MDHIDKQILERLQVDGRISLSQLSKELRLSRPSVTERMRRLQERGIVEGFTARISPAALDKNILVLIQLRELKSECKTFEEFVKADTEIIECHRVTGDSCYVMKAAVSSLERLEALIDRLLPYGQVQTSIVLSSPVTHRVLLP